MLLRPPKYRYLKNISRNIFFCFMLGLFYGQLFCQSFLEKEDIPGVQIDERLGSQVPLDIVYANEQGDSVQMGNLIGKPTIISLVYFNCDGTCTPLLGKLLSVMKDVDLTPGTDYNLITISINELEKHTLAANKKNNYLKTFEGDFPEKSWHWLTGKALQIRRLTWATGYKFFAMGNNTFMHPAGLLVLDATGKLKSCLHGLDFTAFDLRLALAEASTIAEANLIDKALLLFYRYDRESRSYMFIYRSLILPGFIVAMLTMSLILLYFRNRRLVMREISLVKY